MVDAPPISGIARISNIISKLLPLDLLLVVQRIGIAAIFFQSGRTKVEGLFTVPQTTIDLFELAMDLGQQGVYPPV